MTVNKTIMLTTCDECDYKIKTHHADGKDFATILEVMTNHKAIEHDSTVGGIICSMSIWRIT